MKQVQLLTLVFLALCSTAVVAQDTLRPRWSVHGGISINDHSADFRALPGVPNCCPLFENGSGTGPTFGVGYEFPVGPSLLLAFGLGYVDHSALLSAREPVSIVSGGELRGGVFDHTIDATFGSIGFEPTLAFRPIDGLFVRGGLRLGAILSPTYAQKEEIVEPAATGTFLDSLGNDSGLRTRNVSSGDIPDAASFLAQGTLGVEYELPIDPARTLLLTPGISYSLGLTDVVKGYSWKPNELRVTLAVKYSPLPSKPVMRDTIYRRDTTVVSIPRGGTPGLRLERRETRSEETENPAFVEETTTVEEHYLREIPKSGTVALAAVGLENGREQSVATLRIEEFLQTNAHPVLGYLFFDEGSAEIPDRYVRTTPTDAERFEPGSLFGEDALGVAHNVLNILGYNMRRYGDARLTITGCNSGNGVEAGNRALSHDRAEAVKRYLVDVWKIDPDRLSVVERDLPEVPSNTRTSDGSQENRRVEITSDVPEVTDAFIAHDTTRTATPPSLRFKPSVRSFPSVASWKLGIVQNGTLLKEFSGSGVPPATVDWDIASEQRSVPRFSDPLTATLDVVDGDGDRESATTTLATDLVTVRRKEASGARDYRIEQYNLVLFDVGRSTINDTHRRTIDLVRSRLESGSTVTVEGYSDRTGDDAANRRLALARARATADALGRSDASVVGIGEDRLLYPNDTPEGRFYCRTVRITVRTPIR